MKAVLFDRNIAPDNLVSCDIDKPVPKENEVFIKIYAVSLNAADYRSMKMGLIPKKKYLGQISQAELNLSVKTLHCSDLEMQ
jgi:NADPH:quinone reductase-like Zn-dependent oxidoreductase